MVHTITTGSPIWGTVPDVVQRALSTLVSDGTIEVQRHQIRILDRPALEFIANGLPETASYPT